MDGTITLTDLSKLVAHFNELRGFILSGDPERAGDLDGDGTITSRGYLSFIVNSPLFGEQIKNILEQDNICWCVIDRVVKSIIPYWVVRVNGTNHDKRTSILKIYHKLYDDKYYYLQRKKIKFEEYLDIK